MTDLTQALAELRRVTPPNSPWEAGDIGGGSSPVDYHIATILNAVISGDLIPKSDAGGDTSAATAPHPGEVPASSASALIPRAEADMAVAMMVEKAMEVAMSAGPSYYMTQTDRGFKETHTKLGAFAFRTDIQDAMCALVPASALAELQALRDERDAAVANQFITRVERDGAEDHATETADELRQVRARAELAQARAALSNNGRGE